ncbi:MAG: twin-arginine translocase TatA/TatE family subunit [Planctomycetota bacterium]|nr:twin-arginine translocase TatA/TatE family subunit [Planctomycetota bacterium]MDA1113431.1 twin-arginine translocase TatA/TatE family subunit [Planctomycetota bacterium]
MMAFIGSTELVLAAVVGLLLFGGQLPEVMREIGKIWFGLRRSLNDLKRESGLDDAMRDIKRETDDLRTTSYEWRKDMDPFAGPAKDEPATDADAETDADADAKSEVKPESKVNPVGRDPHQPKD